MKRFFGYFCASALVLSALCGCGQKAETPQKWVDLRYRVNDSYELPARGAQPFTMVISSTDPWTVTSAHPDWCIIDNEEGEASAADDILLGKGEKTTVRVKYYDNTELDDRIDKIMIRSDYWLGKTVTVYQKGIAYLSIPDEEQEITVSKFGGEYSFRIQSNQDWSAKVTEGDWISITEGATGSLDGVVKVQATENAQEQRYAAVTVYDRHGEERMTVRFTQDGVQLDPLTFELRAGYDQASISLGVVSNAGWVAVKDNEADDWYTILNPENSGNGTVNVSLKPNDGTGLRVGRIIVKSIAANPDDYVAQKVVVVKQAYKVDPVRYEFDNDAINGSWKSDQANTPVYTKGVGTYFKSYARLNNGSMPFGSYTFRWSAIDPACRIRHWFCYSDGQEIKYNIMAAKGGLAIEFNSSSSGVSGKPTISTDMALDITKPIEVTLKFDPSGAEYCHVTYYCNGVEVASFDSSDEIMHMVKWGKSINMYVGVDTGGSAVCEWYEYTAPVNWDE